MRFKRENILRLYETRESDEFKPVAVPGGLHVPGSSIVKVWMQSSLDDEFGVWGFFPMIRCSTCNSPNHRPECIECYSKRVSVGAYTHNCRHCGENFKSKERWQRVCSLYCRKARTKFTQKMWNQRQKH